MRAAAANLGTRWLSSLERWLSSLERLDLSDDRAWVGARRTSASQRSPRRRVPRSLGICRLWYVERVLPARRGCARLACRYGGRYSAHFHACRAIGGRCHRRCAHKVRVAPAAALALSTRTCAIRHKTCSNAPAGIGPRIGLAGRQLLLSGPASVDFAFKH